MNEFERNLRDALARRPPPEGFAGRVLARTADSGLHRGSRRWVRWALAAVAILVLTAGLFIRSDRIERVRGEQAKQEVLLALRVVGRTLNQVEERVRQAQPLRVGQPDNN